MSKEQENIPAELQVSYNDRLAAIGRSASSALPFIGGTIVEVLTAIIPNQRADRIVGFLVALERRLQTLERDVIDDRLREPESVDLLEDGLYQAVRVTTQERRELLAALIKNGLTNADLEQIQKKKLLDIFGRLNDAEIVILQSYLREHRNASDFVELHKDVLHGPMVHMGSSSDEVDRGAIHDSYRRHLRDLGLLKERFKRARRGELPEFDDKTGMMKSSGFELTRLGGLLLRYLDVTDEEF